MSVKCGEAHSMLLLESFPEPRNDTLVMWKGKSVPCAKPILCYSINERSLYDSLSKRTSPGIGAWLVTLHSTAV